MTRMVLKSPLFTDWSEQYVRLYCPMGPEGAAPAGRMTLDGVTAPFQFTGQVTA